MNVGVGPLPMKFWAKFLERSLYWDRRAWPLTHGLLITPLKRLLRGTMLEIEFKTTVTLVKSKSYSLRRGSNRKIPLFMLNLIVE